MTVVVSSFFAPTVPKRPPNFVVVKYFLLGLLISNSIESILIIPKILDVLDQSAIQAKAMEEMDIKREELKELVAEKRKQEEEQQRETQRELNVLMKEKGMRNLPEENEQDESEEEEEETRPQHHKKGQRGHHSKGDQGEKKNHPKENELVREIRKRPQRLETGNNYVAVFMLFYGSITLCLGIPAIFKESIRLLQGLMFISCLGTITLVSAKFSLIMIMSVIKDTIIVALTFYYMQMIQQSDPAVDQAQTTAGQPVGTIDPTVGAIPQVDPSSYQTGVGVAGVTVDYSQGNVQQVYNPTAQPAGGW